MITVQSYLNSSEGRLSVIKEICNQVNLLYDEYDKILSSFAPDETIYFFHKRRSIGFIKMIKSRPSSTNMKYSFSFGDRNFGKLEFSFTIKEFEELISGIEDEYHQKGILCEFIGKSLSKPVVGTIYQIITSHPKSMNQVKRIENEKPYNLK